MNGFVVPAAITALAVLALLASERQGAQLGVWLTKPVASTGFVLAAVAAGAGATRVGTLTLVALMLCALGDVLLIPKEHPRAFLAGLITFLMGHIALCVAFVQRGVAAVPFALGLLGVGLVSSLVGRWLIPKIRGRMQGPVGAYMLTISIMVALAVGTVADRGGPELVVAAVAFYLSDLSVALHRFIRPAFVHKLWGLPLYYGATLLLAWSVRVTP